MNANPSIAVVGGSLTGPALTLMLAQVGIENVTLYEAMVTPTQRAGGIIGLMYDSLASLERLGISRDEFCPYPSDRTELIELNNRLLGERKIRLFPGHNAVWTLLNRALYARLGHKARAGKRVTGMRAGSTGAVLEFSDGDTAQHDLVAFADGRQSIGRKLLSDRKLNYAGYIAHRGQVAVDPDFVDFTWFQNNGHRKFGWTPAIMDDGSPGIDWELYTVASANQFREWFGAGPTKRTYVQRHQISDEAWALVDNEATRLLPDDMARLVHGTTQRAAVPVVDSEVPGTMCAAVGNARAILLGDAIAPVHPHTASGANNGLSHANAVASMMSQVCRGSNLDRGLEWLDTSFLPVIAGQVARGRERAKEIIL